MLINFIKKKRVFCFSSKLKENSKVKYADYFDLKEHKNEITDPRFQMDLLIDKNNEMNITRYISDENFLNSVGLYLPEVEQRTAYYKILHEGKMYHVFNAEKIVN